jgi:hypothetical protein
MTYRMYAAFIACLSVVALMLGANETFAGSGAAHRGGFASRHSTSHLTRSFRHHRRNDVGIFWPGAGDFYYEPSSGEPIDGAPPIPGDFRNTQAADVPWDWAHRYPPAVSPSERPYVPSCPTETVTVPGGHDGNEKTVSVTRCY